MSRVDAGTEEEISSGTEEKLEVIPDRLADEVLEAQDWRPEALRVMFKAKNDPQRTVSWAIPISAPDLRPFTSNVPQGEAALRREIERMLDSTPRWGNFYSNYLKYWMPSPGTHIGYLDEIRHGVSADTGKIWSFIQLVTKDNLKVDFPAGWPEKMEKRVGETPQKDWVGPREEFNSGKSPFYYLCQLGLDWDKWTDVELEEAVALFPGHYDEEGRQIAPYFEDFEDWSTELMDACTRHGLKPVQFTTEIHPKHSLSVTKPKGKYFFQLIPVVMGDTAEAKAFEAEKEVFLELYENLTRVVLEKPKARFVAGTGKPTKEGDQIARGIIVPVVKAYPDLVKKRGAEGGPIASFPIKFEDWRTNGLAVLDFLAERLMGLDSEELFKVVNLTDPESLLAWAEENVTELADDMSVDETEDYG